MRIALGAGLLAALVALAPSAAVGLPGGAARLLHGTQRADLIVGRPGRDSVDARAGADRVAVQYDGARDAVRCGAGRDVVTADAVDRLAADCEVVTRLVSHDPTRAGGTQHHTQVEPSSAAAGSTVLTAFQSGRRAAGAAADIGFSLSLDGGRTWQDGGLPGITVASKPAGTASYASDPAVAYDAAHGTWLVSTLAVSSSSTEIYVSRSADGLHWSRPVVAARAEGDDLGFDKNWVSCDNWPQSPHRGRCYLAYTDDRAKLASMSLQVSDDGGVTWSGGVTAVSAPEVVGVLPVPRPDGSLVVPYLSRNELQSVRSTDGGQTFEEPVTVVRYVYRTVRGVRSFPLPAADTDAQGRLYVAWQDCRARSLCAANDVLLATSRDGTSWSKPTRATHAGGSAFVPALAVDHATGRLALAFHRCSGSPCRIDVLAATSNDGGRTWTRPQVLDAQPMRSAWLAATSSGRMLGDYIGLSWSAGRPVTVYSLASPPRNGAFRQAIAAVRLP